MSEEVDQITAQVDMAVAKAQLRKQQRRLEIGGRSLLHYKLLFQQWLLRMISGWSDSLLYRDAGERGLRTFLGMGNVPLFALGLLLSIILGPPGTIFLVIFLWAFALHLADALAARYRRQHEQEEGYLYSYFIGWPRWLPPTKEASRWQQGAILMAVGVILAVWDRTGGLLLLITGASVCRLQRIARLIEREERSDVGDAEWMQNRHEAVKAEVTGTAQDQELSEEDYILRYS